MNNQDGMKLHGSLELVLRRANGDVEVARKDNIIVNAGFDFIADAIGKVSGRPTVMGYIALGTDATTATAVQTALIAEVARQAATYAHTSGTKTFTFTGFFDVGIATGALVEAGILNDPTVGTLLDRVVFAVINKGAGDTLTATFTFTMS